MMRFLFFFFLIFPLFVFAEPGKVVGVIPVKFNSKGMHAPVPYNQQLMDRGWTRVPTLNLPFTYAGGAGQNPRYQPTKVTKKSFARGLGYLAGRVGSMTPASKALLIAYGAYEANCVTQNYPSLCIDGEEEDTSSGTCPVGSTPMVDVGCTVSAPKGGMYSTTWRDFSGAGFSPSEAFANLTSAWAASSESCMGTGMNSKSVVSVGAMVGPYSGGAFVSSFTGKTTCTYTVFNTTTQQEETKTTETTSSYTGITIKFGDSFYCPPEGPAFSEFMTLVPTGTDSAVCAKPFEPAFKPVPVTPEWIEEQMDLKPDVVKNSDVGLDDFVDWETGLPRPDAFEDPTYDPVSPAFANAAEAIANGTVQHDNPNGDGYVPREMMPNLLVQINNWHEGNTFTDIFTGKEVQPDAPPPEESNIDWSKFPGITKAQYEASNNAWGNAAVNGKPDINSELDKLTQEQQKLTDFINEPLPDLPYEIDFPSLFQLPTTGQCRGFTVTGSIRGSELPIIVDKHCPPYDAWGRPVIDWFLGIMTIFQCFHIFRRTIEVA